MPSCSIFLRAACVLICAASNHAAFAAPDSATVQWSGSVYDASGRAAGQAELILESHGKHYSVLTTDDGAYHFAEIARGSYKLSARFKNQVFRFPDPVSLPIDGLSKITLLADGSLLLEADTRAQASGGETLSATSVAAIPLNKRDFSQLLLLAAGTMTDTNGTTNFTQQFAVNGQRGVEAVFATDGSDTSDPEMGGATLSNFNVDAVQEIQSFSGWMPADIGRGAAGFTNVITRAGTDALHGSLFEFLRNSALDARNFFDRRSPVNPDRIPPFRRNEFGFTLGGPVIFPGYNGRSKTEFFAEYQGFRQVLGTTQVLPVPTAAERSGIDTTAYPGDTLFVPVNPTIAALLRRYPLPNDPSGPFGARTFATSSKVVTDADQFSLRLDHQLSTKDRFFARFTADNLNGPTTNPDQTAIDPSFGITYVDHQRNAVLTWSRTPSARFTSESSLSFTRTTPNFPTPDHTDPSLIFADGLYEAFDSPGGSVTASFGNLFEGRQNFTWTRSKHAIKAGGEFRANRDTTYFGTTPNGQYVFGGGAAFATTAIRSASGLHDIQAGQQLPDTLTALLLGSAFSYIVAVAPPQFPQGDQIGVAAVSRYGVNAYLEDTWKISGRFVLDYGLRYELYSPISERARRTAGVNFLDGPSGPEQQYLINPEPVYRWRGNNWGPRIQLSWQPTTNFWIRAGGALTTIPPNIWQDNLLTGAAPYVDYPRITAAPGSPLLIGTRITPADLPGVYTPSGVNILASGNSKAVPVNTVWDVDRFDQSLAALTPSHPISPLNVNAISQDFRNAYLGTSSLSLERSLHGLTLSAGYIGTAGISLPAINFPNGFPGATAAFAPYTRFNAAGQITGGFGTDMLMTNRSHSTYHALQSSLQGAIGSNGPQIQLNFTWSKSIDDDSTVIGPGVGSTSGASALAWPQNPFDTRDEKGPSTFDVSKVFTATVIQDLHAERAPVFRFLGSKLTRGWQLLSISTLNSGLPFTVYSGVQQTGAGSIGTDRPDQIASPDLSTSRTVREDYFGLGAANASFFYIPIDLPDGTGPNSGRFGTLGRNTFRGPALYNFDFALIKDTSWEAGRAQKLIDLEFRAEFFNLFNIVNFGLPSNIVTGSGFGFISRTASNSRQIQFSLKTIF
ncbi:MAG TPA: TonB-dependent receptor [Bryobacteraceae bacterium]|nr:TonB-dependent receptor [Bryobacteraceae bacterium]